MLKVAAFKGKLIGKNGEAEITFRTHFAKSGDLVFEIDDLPFTEDMAFLIEDHSASDTRLYEINGVSEDDRHFHTTDFLTSKCSSRLFTALGGMIKVGGSCSTAKIFVPVEDVHQAPAIALLLKGLENFKALSEQTPLGTVEMSGTTNPDDHDKVLGQILIKADNLDDMTAVDWQERAGALANHVRRVMSFGFGINLRTPATQVWYHQTMTIYYRSQTEQRKPSMSLIMPIHLNDMFKAAVTSFFSLPIEANKLFISIEWFTMETTYNEVRLINVMTAIENLINSNIEDEYFMTSREFDKLRKSIRGTIREWFKNNGRTPEEYEALISKMNEKLGDVNRLSFRDKLKILIDQWGVPMNGIRESDIKAAKHARDMIAHRGRYYLNDGSEEIHLWDHFCIVREIFVRIILTVIGFTGSYHSLLGGSHWESFPQNPKSVEFPSIGS